MHPVFLSFKISTGFLFLLIAVVQFSHGAMTFAGPISASSVTVTGNVTVSSMTVSSMVVTELLDVKGSYPVVAGRILQVQYVSSTVTTTTTNTSWTAVSSLSRSITLSSATNHVCITLTGGLYMEGSDATNVHNGYVTVFRDSTNLGNATYGLTSAQGFYISTTHPYNLPGSSSAGISLIDSPGDTSPHTYQAYIYTSYAPDAVAFPKYGTGYLVLEEVSH